MIVFRTPKGWTGPKFVDGKPVEGTWRAHQVPIADFKNPEHLKQLEDWMKSYRPHELFDEHGKFRDEFAALRRRVVAAWAPIRTPMGANCCSLYRCPTSVITPSQYLNPAALRRKRRGFSENSCAT